jgi:RHS repeat-associated protein
MKKYIIIFNLFLFAGSGLMAQTFSNDNFIYTVAPKKAAQSSDLNKLTKDEISQNVTYFDGLGRPIQTIAIGQGGDGQDIVTPMRYDGLGRQEKEYLPYTVANGGNTYPLIDPVTAINAAVGFYSSPKYENTANPFSQKQYENSPLNRVLKQAAPGASWAMGSGHEIKLNYQTNTSADAVKLYRVTTSWQAGQGLYEIGYPEEGSYAENELYKTVTYDENSGANPSESSGSTVEFKNKEGQVVLKRTYDAGDRHDTYYVYDIYGNLTYVIPPKVTGAIDLDKLNGLCYQYKYDDRNRLVEKKLPVKQWEFIVYDKLDRPVATGPVFSPFKDENTEGWLITKYDAFGRPIYTGWINQSSNSPTRKSLQDVQNAATILFETKQTSGTTIDGVPVNYSNVIAPTNFKILTINYYDDYDFPLGSTRPTTIEDQKVLANTKGLLTGTCIRVLTTSSIAMGEITNIVYDDIKARPIRTQTQNHLGGYTNTDTKLDFSGKVLYTITKHKRTYGDNELTVREEFTYSPQDRLLNHTHQINGGTVQLLASNSYDALGQLESKNVGNTGGNQRQKVDYSYNIRGWLTGINNTENLQIDTDPLDLFAFKINYNNQPGNSSVDALYNGNIAETFWKTASDYAMRSYGYQYDDLNRLTNAIYRKPGDAIPVSGAYNESLSYDKNGNIKLLQRYGDSDAPSVVFKIDDLTYDYLNENSNQLTKVTDSPAGNNSKGFIDGNKNGDDFGYDANGNMTSDKNKNITDIKYNHLNLPKKITFGTNGTIEYIYNATGQKVEKIVKNAAVTTYTNYLGGFQYMYGENQGNQGGGGVVSPDPGDPIPDDPQDPEPPIDGTDPVINPPQESSRFSGLAVQSTSQEVPTRPTLQFFPTAEGYVKNDSGVFSYVFQYKDHLGNVRLSYAKNPQTQVLEIIEENNYYPFGLKHQGYNIDSKQIGYNYKYNGKELQDELGLNMYDYGARNYDPALGRWMNIDPLAEEMSEWSTYNYVFNNPVYFIDPDGKGPTEGPGPKSRGAAIIASGLGGAAMISIAGAGPQGIVLEPAAGVVAVGSLIIGGGVMIWDAMTGNDDSSSTPIYNATAGTAPGSDKSTNNKAKEKSSNSEPTKAEARAEKLSRKQREGQDFTKAGKEAVIDVNKEKNNGKTVCVGCNTETIPATQSQKGVTPAKNETRVDHRKAKAKGGSGTPDNGDVLCSDCNLKKGAK